MHTAYDAHNEAALLRAVHEGHQDLPTLHDVPSSFHLLWSKTEWAKVWRSDACRGWGVVSTVNSGQGVKCFLLTPSLAHSSGFLPATS